MCVWVRASVCLCVRMSVCARVVCAWCACAYVLECVRACLCVHDLLPFKTNYMQWSAEGHTLKSNWLGQIILRVLMRHRGIAILFLWYMQTQCPKFYLVESCKIHALETYTFQNHKARRHYLINQSSLNWCLFVSRAQKIFDLGYFKLHAE